MIQVLASIILLFTLTCAPVFAASHFDGADSAIVITQQAAINTSVFTVGCWTKYATLGEGNLSRIVSKDTAWDIRIQSGPLYRLTVQGWDGSDAAWQITAQAANTWAHVAVSYDATSTGNDPVMYLNGAVASLSEITIPIGTFVPGTGNLYIGNVNGSGRTWDGELGECFYYDRVLTSLEVMQVKVKGPTSLPRGRIGYWPMGVFGGRNYTSTTGLDGTETAITQVGPHPPLSYASQGSTP